MISLTAGLLTQMSDSGSHGPLIIFGAAFLFLFNVHLNTVFSRQSYSRESDN